MFSNTINQQILDKRNNSTNTTDDNKDAQSQEKLLLPLSLVTKHILLISVLIDQP